MKKIFRYSLFAFIFACLSMFITNKVSASSNFYNEIESYVIEKEDTGEKYRFDKENEKYNYKFDYSYTIDTTGHIIDDLSPVSYFYGITEDTEISYFPIDSSFGITVHAKMSVYKYNFTTKEFDYASNNPAADTTGTYLINQQGLYKVLTDGVDGTSRVVYIIYEKEFYSANIDQVVFNKNDKTIEIDLTIKDPRDLRTKAGFKYVYVGHSSGMYSTNITNVYDISKVDGENDLYKVFISMDALGSNQPYGADVVIDGDIKIEFDSNVVKLFDCVNYDLAKPIFKATEYYNDELYLKELNPKINYIGSDILLPTNSVAVIKVIDDTSIVSAKLNGNIDCKITPNTEETVIECMIIGQTSPNELIYTVTDEYGNENTMTHNATYDNEMLSEGDELSNYINISGYEVSTSFDTSSYQDIDIICLIYGNDLSNDRRCADMYGVESSYHYQGNAIIVALDKARNYVTLQLEDVLFTKGYDLENFIFDVEGDTNSLDVTDNLNDLYDLVCVSGEQCVGLSNYYVKYGNVVEPLKNEETTFSLPSYLEILNNKFRDKNCAVNECDKSVEVYIEYDVGETKQKVSMIYRYDDKLAYITDRINKDDLVLEFGKFDINSNEMKQRLYGDELEVSLQDDAGTRYVGKIIPMFIEYVSKEGDIRKIDNKSYTYISAVSEFGTYLLECKVKLITNITTGVDYTDDVYGKSFFIKVTLDDTTIPTLTLLGESNIEVQQYDAYKDASAKCSDLSGCVVNVTYYLDEVKEENKVNGIDTKTPGKYLIRYVAVDSAGNSSFEVIRTVTVSAIDDLNATSIIIIVSVVLVFALFVTLGIILEVRKNKRRKEME